MKKLLRLLFILVLLGLGFLYIVKNPELWVSQTILKTLGLERLLTGNTVTIANPASVYCEQNSWTLEIIIDLSGGQSWICHLPDGTTCDEWGYFRGECPSTGTNEMATGSKLIGDELCTKDINTAYYNGKTIEWADLITLDCADERTVKDKNNVRVKSLSEEPALIKIEWADSATFSKIWVRYYQDKNNVYYDRGELYKITWADPESFEILDGYYAKDKNNVYYEWILVEWADPATFGDICRDWWARDKNNVYSNWKILPGADPQKYGCGA